MTQSEKRFLGITVLSPFFQNEGVKAVLDNLINNGVTAVACNTSVTVPSREGEGSWQPPHDAGASVRLFDRPLWGEQALWLRSGPGHKANRDFYANSHYKPRDPNDLTTSEGPIIGEFIRTAKARGLKVYIQTSATQPPGMRPEDTPHLPDGRVAEGRMANTGCLASPAVRRYINAWTQDIFEQYPEVDGIRPDWPEYPCYKLDEAFQDFNPHVKAWAEAHGFNYDRIHESVLRFYRYLHDGKLTNDDLVDFASQESGRYAITRFYNQYPGIADWFRLKAALSTDLLQVWCNAIKTHGGREKELAANAFMPSFSYFTGLDFANAAPICESIAPKLYTMHWALMIKFWGDTLMKHNPSLDETLLVKTLVNLFDMTDGANDEMVGDTLAYYHYPEPDEPHPVSYAVQRRKINQVTAAVGGPKRSTQIYPLVHGYGPHDDFRHRFQIAADAVAANEADGIWINRYGYLSDEKLTAVGEVWRKTVLD